MSMAIARKKVRAMRFKKLIIDVAIHEGGQFVIGI